MHGLEDWISWQLNVSTSVAVAGARGPRALGRALCPGTVSLVGAALQRLPPAWEGRRGWRSGWPECGEGCGNAAACTRAGAASLRTEAQRSGSRERCPAGQLGLGQRREPAAVGVTVPLVPEPMCLGRSEANPARTPSRLPFPYSGFPPVRPNPVTTGEAPAPSRGEGRKGPRRKGLEQGSCRFAPCSAR